MHEITDGTWLDWNRRVRRAMGPAHKPAPEATFEVVELCNPAEWEAGETGADYDVVRRPQVSVLDEADGLTRWHDVCAEASRRRAEMLGRCP